MINAFAEMNVSPGADSRILQTRQETILIRWEPTWATQGMLADIHAGALVAVYKTSSGVVFIVTTIPPQGIGAVCIILEERLQFPIENRIHDENTPGLDCALMARELDKTMHQAVRARSEEGSYLKLIDACITHL